jgi:preprotein translocase subunit SecA
MLHYIAKQIFGTRNDRILKSVKPLVQQIQTFEGGLKSLSDAELARKTVEFKERVSRGESLESLNAEAFAVVREASTRVLGMRHFDVQMIGGAVLHMGKIAEMRTGEGKTLVATLPSYLNALAGKGVHVVTVNDYLARRDAEWMGRLFGFLGLSVGVVYSGMNESEKRAAYQADITYGQNNEFGFDYLRDNMKFHADDQMQRGHFFAVVDEVDSILIDEARTPLIISGPAEDATDRYRTVNAIIPRLKTGEHFEVDLKSKQPSLTEDGVRHVEELLAIDNLYDPGSIEFLHHVNQALKAYTVFERDVDYVVKDGQIIIVDEFTGRLMPGRRWSDGLHQAVEAKEGIKINRENQTLASITFQNYFRMYEKLSGMTGTADTEASEFKQIYNLEVVVVPTNRAMIRADESDQVFRSKREKYQAAAKDIKIIHETGQPILVGTISIEQSEALSRLLKEEGVPHQVLNAKHHEREAEIVAQAGRLGAVTISTNMAGRGTDIILGGNPEFLAASEVKTRDRSDENFIAALEKFKSLCAAERETVLAAGGLFILGTERHESRRIDNQLRGRAGRQGDPGRSRFYVSLEDDLMLRFGGDKIQQLMSKLGWEDGVALEGRMISGRIESAQKRVEGYHFEMRKHVTEYDDVMNKQRQVVYNLRSKVLGNDALRQEVLAMVDDLLEDTVLQVCDERTKPMEWNIDAIKERFQYLFDAPLVLRDGLALSHQALFDAARQAAHDRYNKRLPEIESKLAELERLSSDESTPLSVHISRDEGKPFNFETIEQDTVLESLDHYWNQHLHAMDHLREGIGLRGYGQKNPLYEYQKEGFLLFQNMITEFKENVVRKLYYYEVPDASELIAHFEAERARREKVEEQMKMVHQDVLEPEAVSGSGDDLDTKSPDDIRAKMLAQKKARRKMKGK